MDYGNIRLQGIGHWTCTREFNKEGGLEYRCWQWHLDVKGVLFNLEEDYKYNCIPNRKYVDGKEVPNTNFIKEIHRFFPNPIPDDPQHINWPDSVPGGTTLINVWLSEMIEPDKALEVLMKYFPYIFKKQKKLEDSNQLSTEDVMSIARSYNSYLLM